MALEPKQYESLARLRYGLRRFLAYSERLTRAAGVTSTQYQALLAIKAWPDGRMSIKALAEQLLLKHNAAVQLVNRLAAAGLAARHPCHEDRRTVLLALTPKGGVLVDELASNHLRGLLGQESLLAESLERLRDLGPPA